jgi:general L-amino acid transport system permease protein
MRRAPRTRRWSWRSQAARALLWQVLAVLLLAGCLWYLASNTVANMKLRGIQSGFDFLLGTAGFDIGESLIPFESVDPYWKALLVGLLNTLRVALTAIVFATVLGTLIGIGRFSANAMVRGLCYGYVELFRNVPLLLQLLMWYLLLVEYLPAAQEPLSLGQVLFLSKGGLAFPVPLWSTGLALALAGLPLGLLLGWWLRRRDLARFALSGGKLPSLYLKPAGVTLAVMLLGWLAGGAPMGFSVPVPSGFTMEGGATVTPEFLAVLLGLTFYTAAFIAEVVRSGIASVSRGQADAAASLSLSPAQTMRLVTLPQALRVIIPPMTNQYLNLTKNSSLAVAVGYPDLVSISNTALNQTGRAVECISMIMLVYLLISLGTSALMNIYNRRSAIRER